MFQKAVVIRCETSSKLTWSRLFAGKTQDRSAVHGLRQQPTHTLDDREKIEEEIEEAAKEQGKRDVVTVPKSHTEARGQDQFYASSIGAIRGTRKFFFIKTQQLILVPDDKRAHADPPVIEPWNSDSDDVPVKARENIFVERDNGDPSKSRATTGPTPLTNAVKGKPVVNNDFYHEPFIFKESDRDVRDLVASTFTTRIRDYDMPDGIKVPTNLRTYDGTTDPGDHLTVIMGPIDGHKLLEPTWCIFFHITLYGAARFLYNNLTPESIDGFHQGMIQLNVVTSTLHVLVKFQTQASIAIIKGERFQGERFQPNVCNHISWKRGQLERADGTEDVERVVINDAHSYQTITIAANLTKTLKQKLCDLLHSNKDVFAWTPKDITGIPLELAEHKFNIHPRTFSVRQSISLTFTHELSWKANMKLNSKKCTFEVESGQYLGYMITNEGIQANLEKVQAIINMSTPRTLCEVQALNGCLNKKDFLWNAEAEAAFQELKSHLQSLPALMVKNIVDTPENSTSTWTLFTDVASSIEASGAWLILTDPNGQEITYALRFNFRASNNEADYKALVPGLELAI
nr:reverse transcriptase domain-containing protein [Tanacetum cinerariifolium]